MVFARLFRFYAWVVRCVLLCPLRSGDSCTRLCREVVTVLRLRTVGHCCSPDEVPDTPMILSSLCCR